MAQSVLSIDLGSGGLKVGVVDATGHIVASATVGIELCTPSPGAAEQDPKMWWTETLRLARDVVQQVQDPHAIVAVAVTGQWASTVPVGEGLEPVGNCRLWMDTRGGPQIKARLGGHLFGYAPFRAWRYVRRSGGVPSLSGADPTGQMLALREDDPGTYQRTTTFLEPVDFLTSCFSGRAVATRASQTALWMTDNRPGGALAYDASLLGLSGIDGDRLPPLFPVGTIIGRVLPDVAASIGLGDAVYVVSGIPDLHSAIYGSGLLREGETHLCLSTSSWFSTVLAQKRTDVLHSIASVPGVSEGGYLAANNHETAGECLDWLRTIMAAEVGGELPFAEMDALAEEVPIGAGGVLFTPWLNGERSPVDDRRLRSSFLGLSLGTGRAEMIRSVLEGVALSNRWLWEPYTRFIRSKPRRIRVLGGGASSDLWCQIHADVLDVVVERVSEPLYVNVKGVALYALRSLDLIDDEEVEQMVEIDRTFSPDMTARARYDELYGEFKRAYRSTKSISHRLSTFPLGS